MKEETKEDLQIWLRLPIPITRYLFSKLRDFSVWINCLIAHKEYHTIARYTADEDIWCDKCTDIRANWPWHWTSGSC